MLDKLMVPNTPEQQERYDKAYVDMRSLLDDRLAKHLVERVFQFSGNFDRLESAIGALVLGRIVGWRVLRLLHSHATYRRYEKILDLEFQGKLPWDLDQDVMPERGAFFRKSLALNFADKVGGFWKVFQGQTDIDTKTRKQASQGTGEDVQY